MKIGFDAKRAFNNQSGLGVYARDLIQGISRLYPSEQIVLFTPKVKTNLFHTSIETITHSLGWFWRSLWIYFDIKKKSLDIYHGLAGELPLFIPAKTKKIVTIHDILFERFPQDYPFVDRTIYAWKAKWACYYADIIVTISEATKQDLISYYHIDKDKIQIVPYAIDTINFTKGNSRSYSRDYILCISSFMKRKNQQLLVNAYAQIVHKVDFDLILIGKGKQLKAVKSIAKKLSCSHRIIFKTDLSNAEKYSYLEHCLFTVYPSLYEGFGIPILESFIYNKSIVLSDTTIHKEVAGNAGIYFENNNEVDLANKLLEWNSISSKLSPDMFIKRINLFQSKQVLDKLYSIYSEIIGRLPIT